MKLQFVKTSNYQRVMAGLAAVENRGSAEACILLLTGEPGTGKSRTIDHIGSYRNALYLEGVPGMNLSYVRDFLAEETGVSGSGRYQQFTNLTDHLKTTRQPIIFDEAQHGLPNKAECIEYLRRVAEKAEVVLVLVCHTSERQRFSSDKLAHIYTRIASLVELKKASLDDCGLYLRELCEVGVDEGVIAKAFEDSGGRYRLLANACKTLEAIAGKLGKAGLTQEDIKNIRLCEDAMKTIRGGKKGGSE